MKLFSFSDTENRKQTEIARDVARTESVREVLKDVQMKLSKAEADFDFSMAKQRKAHAQQETKHLETIDALQKEIQVLEERKKKALFPIDDMNKRAYDNLERSEKTLEEAEKQKRNNEDITELLTDKLDEVGATKIDLDYRSKKILVNELAIIDQKKQLKTLSESTSAQWQLLHAANIEHDAKVRKFNEEYDKKNADLIVRERKLAEDTLALRKEISKDKALIKDREDTLARDIQREKNKWQTQNTTETLSPR